MKSLRLFLVVTFALALVLTSAPVQAQGQGGIHTCQEFAAWVSGTWPTFPGLHYGTGGPFEEATYIITITPVDGPVNVSLVDFIWGATVLAGPANAPVTFTYVMGPVASQPQGLFIRVNSVGDRVYYVAISVSCAAAPVPFAGCDALVALPADAVVGQFVADAAIYWEPRKLVSPQVTIAAGKTYWVAGQDATGMFRKVMLSCQWVWVEADTVGPNPDAVWNSRPLPTTVVE